MMADKPLWPKQPPVLNAEQLAAREKFMRIWHETLPNKYGLIDRFNQGFVASLPYEKNIRTLEIGAGIGEHAKYEDLSAQDYHCLEYREDFCRELRQKFSPDKVVCGDIQKRLDQWPDGYFQRIIAIHVLEHLVNLPAALVEIKRLLADGGVFDIVLPTEGSLAYTFARKISAERLFYKHFDLEYEPIIKNEHVSTLAEVRAELEKQFTPVKTRFFPLPLPLAFCNIVVGMRLKKK